MKQPHHMGVVVFLIAILIALGIYIGAIIGGKDASSPALKWYTYLAIEPSTCIINCSLVEYYRKKEEQKECMIKKVTSTGAHDASIQDLSIGQWLAEKWKKKYIFDLKGYNSFQEVCKAFPEDLPTQ